MRHQIPEKQKISKPSSLLTQDENEQVFSLLGRKCQSLSTAVIQLFKTESSAHSNWRKKHTAVLCFIKDSSKRSYFMRAYCLIRNELVWEHELYENIEIFKTRPFLLTFEGQDGHVAFNFASESECESYHRIVGNTIETRNRKRQERRNRPKSQLAPNIPPQMKLSEVDGNNVAKVQLRNNPNLSSVQLTPATVAPPKLSFGNLREKNKGNRKYTKNDISTPTNFIHISHVGWDAQKGFDLTGSEDDEMLKPFFHKAGVSEQQLNDRDTRAFIYDFVQHHNIIAAVKTERIEKPKAPAPPPVPKRDHNQNGQNQRTAPPPPPPTRQPPPPVPTTTPLVRAPPPTRPPPINISSTPTTMIPSSVPPPPPQPPAAPPPPPMPMPSGEKISAPSTLPVVSDNRSALMDSIRKGANLKKVDPASLSTGIGGGDARNELLSEIRHGTTLRPVTNREIPSGSFNRDSGSGGTDALADALRRALQDRGRAIHSSEDESSTSSDNDGEWED